MTIVQQTLETSLGMYQVAGAATIAICMLIDPHPIKNSTILEQNAGIIYHQKHAQYLTSHGLVKHIKISYCFPLQLIQIMSQTTHLIISTVL